MASIVISAAVIILAVFLFFRYFPAFGGRPSEAVLKRMHASTHFDGKVFQNTIPTSMDMNGKDILSMLQDYAKGNPRRKPVVPVPVVPFRFGQPLGTDEARVTWLGHSAFILEMEGKTLLVDPMLGSAPTPFPWFGNKRFSKQLPFEMEQLPEVDAIVFSHDHYDHLDYHSFQKLKHKARRFIVPLGVGSHLERWGADPSLISEHDWHNTVEFNGIKLICAPARHFSGRSLTDRNTTLWCSWAFIGQHNKIFYSGDSGYGPHFKEIGDSYGPFDLTLMECGQYDTRWASIHMMPEETVQAHMDVKGRTLIPVHWGAFILSFHDWNDPVKRAWKASKENGVHITVPKIGETVTVGETAHHSHSEEWWRE
ncbi:MBL fold metallo-hydrolase [Fictibacillus iocasae]|uniref:MBL fold metallo-hydrolase n=1 Tax=Fictibacillus iocasae TaxID=2715437 RepID=A0ABW2NSM3_9BACL